ncbi:MAG: bifunctional riboflavin kinase/FAD synthetase [Alphaproteobacteria bacterium]|nr:bifunctional riboflavin kinase/FAD synthetase [Alphaproteobacteria bacterium]
MTFHVLDGLRSAPDAVRGGVVAIGNFDGCHRGHQSVFDIARAQAAAKGSPALMLTFEPHPRDVFSPEPFMYRLTTGEAKARLAEAIGFDGIVVMPFTRDFAAFSAQSFVDDILVGALGVHGVVAGADFLFGKARAGTPEFLAAEGVRLGFDVTITDMLDEGDAPVSSSRVRRALGAGKVREANILLGYHHMVGGRVIHGARRGRELGYPTANIAQSQLSKLRQGIYAIRVRHAGRFFDGVASFGSRPMFDNGAPLFEAHLFDFDGDLYGSVLEVALVEFLRPEQNFSSTGELIAQMDDDSAKSRELIEPERAISLLDARLGFFPA